jgi:hypothetical protein
LEDLDKDGINMKRGLKEAGWNGIKYIHAIQGEALRCHKHDNELLGSIKCREFRDCWRNN